MAGSLAQRIAARLESLPSHDAATLHRLRRELSKQVAGEEPEVIIVAARQLLELSGVPGVKMIAFALVGNHAAALREIDGPKLQRLGKGLASWGDVDMFGCLLAGPAWRSGSITDDVVRRWARSSDRWWRRAARLEEPAHEKAEAKHRGADSVAPRPTAAPSCDKLGACSLRIAPCSDACARSPSSAQPCAAPRLDAAR
jgi:hypothetical protein